MIIRECAVTPSLFARFIPLSIVVAGLVASTATATGTGSDSARGSGESFWGPIPEPSDSLSLVYEDWGEAAWAHAVNLPYHAVRLPLSLVTTGLGAGVMYLDDSGAIPWLARVLGPKDLPYGFTVNFSLGGLVGAGGGATFYHDHVGGERNRLRLTWKSSQNGHHRVVLGTRFSEGQPRVYEVGAGYRTRSNARYFGLGYDAKEEDESFYSQDLTWGGVSVHQDLFAGIRVEPRVLFSAAHARGPHEDDDPTLATQFADDLPPGYRQRSDGVSFGLGLVRDTTTETGRPRLSVYHRLAASYFTSTNDDDISFWSYRAEMQEFLPLWYDDRALAVRGLYARLDPVDGDIPFQRLLTNDDPDLFRGYRDFRWRDQGMAVASAEMRWPLWAGATKDEFGLDVYLFGEAGQVFHDSDELRLDRLEPSYGGGIRFVSFGGFVGRAEYGVSDEESVFRLRGDQIFQFQKGTLFNGRNPIPER
jgi:hypothetical protein